jgi:rfaE bifunctional protein kinase chain/domain
MTDLVSSILNQAPKGADIAFVSGNFNIFHPGHLRLLQFAKECGDFLVVAVCSNRLAAGAALIDEKHRLEALKAISLVDYAFMLDCPAHEFIAALKPAVVVMGKEHETQNNPEADVVTLYGGKLVFASGETVFSASHLLQQELLPDEALRFTLPPDFFQRHDFTLNSLRQLLSDASRARVCVIGDIIVDEYITCEALGMSQEDPTLVVAPAGSQSFLGGAGIVAAHCSGLGAKVHFFTVTGDDKWHDFTKEKLLDSSVSHEMFRDDTRPTTLKQRYRAGGKSLLRVNHLRQHGISQELQDQLLKAILPQLDATDVLVFSDFNYGCLPQGLVERLTSEARKRNIVLMADSQCSSQIGDVSRFKDMDLLTPTEKEARVSTRDHESGLVMLAEKVRHQANAKNVILKLGGEGIMVHATCPAERDWVTDQLPTFNNHPKDTAGAGDSLLAAAAIAMALGGNVWQASILGSLAAACQISRLGNTPLSPTDLAPTLNQ